MGISFCLFYGNCPCRACESISVCIFFNWGRWWRISAGDCKALCGNSCCRNERNQTTDEKIVYFFIAIPLKIDLRASKHAFIKNIHLEIYACYLQNLVGLPAFVVFYLQKLVGCLPNNIFQNSIKVYCKKHRLWL